MASIKAVITGAVLVLLTGTLPTPVAAQTGMPIIRTVVGGGTSDPGDGGSALDAQLAAPGGLARDAAGNLYIADTSHHRIRKLTAATGVITTVAGTGLAGFSGDGGPAVAADLNAPAAVAIDAAGNLYIADTGNHCVRVVSSSGAIGLIAGTPGSAGFSGDAPRPAIGSQLDHPMGVTVDAAGSVYIADRDSHRVRQVTAGQMTTFAGSSDLTPNNYFQLGRLHCPITFICCSPHLPGALGGYNGDGGLASAAELRCPSGVSLDATGNLYIADTDNDAIRMVTSATGIISTIAGGNSYDRIFPVGIEFNCGIGGDGGPAKAAHLCQPSAVATDIAGNLYIADTGNHRIRKVAAWTGVMTTLAGSGITWRTSVYGGPYPVGEQGFSGDEAAAAYALMNGPSGLVVDPAGNVYVADRGNQRIRRIVMSDVSLTGDLDGDGKSELIVWRPSSGTWYWLTSSSGYDIAQGGARQWGDHAAGDVPLVADVDGDRLGDLIVWRASTGTWYWLTSSSGYAYGQARMRQWGDARLGDVPLVGDIDGDGRSDLIVWRASTGIWYVLPSSREYDYGSAAAWHWGDESLGDVPLIGDIDGDGRGDLIVWRATTGTWYWLTSSSGYDYGHSGTQPWGDGSLGDEPLLGDVDGDGKADLTVWRASTGAWYSLSSRYLYSGAAAESKQWGSASAGDVAVMPDLDGDGLADLVVWRASTGTWYWLTSSSAYSAARAKQWGSSEY